MKLKSLIPESTKSNKADVIKVINKIRSKGQVNPINNHEVLFTTGGNTMVGVEMSYFDGYLWMSSITSYEDKRTGTASAVLKFILDEADKAGIPVAGTVKPIGNEGLSKSQLMAWYKRYGFINKGDRVVREPK